MRASSQQNGLLFGRYRLVRELGRTEAGTLFEAFDAHGNQFEIGKTFAVEVANALPDQTAREHFLLDARLAQRLTGLHVLRIMQVATDHDGTPCVVREPSYSDVEIEASKGAIPVSQAVSRRKKSQSSSRNRPSSRPRARPPRASATIGSLPTPRRTTTRRRPRIARGCSTHS